MRGSGSDGSHDTWTPNDMDNTNNIDAAMGAAACSMGSMGSIGFMRIGMGGVQAAHICDGFQLTD